VLKPYETHRFSDVAIVRHYHRAVIGTKPAVIQQMHGGVYIRPLLLGSDYFGGPPTSDRIHERGLDPVAQEVSEIHLNLGSVAL